MDIFEWVKDIERVYEELINKTKDTNLKNIEEYRKEQAENFDTFITKINVLVKTAIGNLTVALDQETNSYEEDLNNAINNVEANFKKNIKNLRKLIIEEVGLDF